MHLRRNTIRRNGKVYRYAQLCVSVRDKNGKSTTKVVKHLGNLPEHVYRAFELALKANREGSRLFLEHEVARLLDGQDVANRRFLELAVLMQGWHDWQLTSLLNRLDTESEREMSLAEVILPLTLQRCVAPSSKLAATRWVPRTALPVLMGFQPESFNNTRVHRALRVLSEITPVLQEKLSDSYGRNAGKFGALFMDVSDTYFEGIGCPLAEQTRTKTEMPNKRCIGIVLLVNEHGYPLRWKLVGGKTKDWTAMKGLLHEIGDASWLHQTPIVFDRAMGNQSTVRHLKQAGLWFLTAAHRTSIESYTADVPAATFSDLELLGTDETYEDDIERVALAAREAGFREINEKLFAVDLGVASPPITTPASCVPGERWRGRPNQLAHHLRMGEQIRQLLEDNPKRTRTAIAEELGLSRSRVGQSLALLELCPEIQEMIHEMGDRFPVPEKDIRSLFRLGPEKQLTRLEALMNVRLAEKATAKATLNKKPAEDLGTLRLVVYFNPQLFVDTRRRADAHLRLIRKRVDELNQELASAKRSRQRDPTFRKFSRELERLHYLDTFDIRLEPLTVMSGAKSKRPNQSFRGSIALKQAVWERRRKYDGFVLLLGHPDLPHSADQLVQFYRGKDVVEKDFQTIKDLEQLRPVFHYTDPKVEAHVTICMLSLLLLRTLRTRLLDAGSKWSAPMALEILSDCHLNERQTDWGASIHHVTKLNCEQEEILADLKLEHLADINPLANGVDLP